MPDRPSPPPLSRRRLLAILGVLGLGGVAGSLLTRLGEAELGDAAARGSTGVAAANAGATAAAASASPGPSPSPSPGPRRSFRSRPDIAAPLIEIGTLAGVPAPGLIFLTPSNGAGTDGPMIADGSGELVWMRPGSGRMATDLRVASLGGRPVLTWWEGANNGGIGAGEHVVADASYRELARIGGGSGRTSDLHELVLTDRGTALLFADASVAAPGPSGSAPPAAAGSGAPAPSLMDCAIQEVSVATGQVLFEWHSVDHVGVDESVLYAPTGENQVYDYFHANSIEIDADGHLIVSARNTSAVYKVDRLTGRVRWRLGGRRSDFAMGEGTAFALQHDVRRQADGTLTIFDDGEAPGTSRGIVLRLDETAMTASLVREFRQPQGLLSTSQGNMQVLPGGNVFIGWGSVPRFSEFAPDGRLVLDAGFTATQSYRDYRFTWAGSPAAPPDVAVDRAGAGAVVFASWNGATAVARWEVLAGTAGAVARPVAAAPRSGFETVIAVPALAPGDTHLAVRASDARGAVLGASVPVALPG